MPEATLRALAAARGLWVGAAYNHRAAAEDPRYRPAFAREMNGIVAENIMKMSFLQPTRGRFDFTHAEAMLAFAAAHGLRPRGHTLVWHTQTSPWLREASFPRAEALAILREHVQTVAARFRGRVAAWDVVNEALADKDAAPDQPLRTGSRWFELIGPDYVEQAFRWAREADPEAQLFYNDYNLESDPAKAERAAAFLGDLLERGVPVDGVGLQYHTSAEDAPDPAQAAAVIERFNRMGLTVHITELDVGIPPAADAAALRRQAEVYAEVVSVALAAADCPAVFTWGLTDRYSWVPGFTNGEKDHALLLDRQYRPKPAHAAVCAALRQG